MHKVAIFADVQNIYYTCRHRYQRHFNYKAFWQLATAQRSVEAAYAYAIERGDAKQRGFQQILKDIGFQVKLKPYIQRHDGSAKGDWDVGITLDVLELAERVDTVILLSGDGDFQLLLERVRRRYRVSSEVYGVAGLTAQTLVNAADKFVAIEEGLLI
ncbi:NYN domain-containing protein [Methylomonas sp. SURF-2]|uniref:NYN domain-containing protein n=1 Tax=Methylomonas subterranea TaxID=2952225 RepID=A0ABT1TM49_9GAMM|nr:NYN domain-containing protein [Methylomonas sp. SURF-2]MCQ8106389.1 NYN domain-containing protein [Methylomonas sp. SURF-2]